jgi:DNA polymerase III delta prime subunit
MADLKITDKQSNEMTWVQKYRPNNINDVILPKRYSSMFANMVASGQVQSMIFSGRQGSGKSTSAFALAKTLKWETLVINASDDRGIDVLRGTLKDYCERGLRNNKPRIVILEEADSMTPQLQAGLRSMMEKHSRRVIFLFTANEPHKIIAPIRESRLVEINFNFTKEEIEEIKKPLFRRIRQICKMEGVVIVDKSTLREFIYEYIDNSCDMRRLIQTIQNIAITNAYTEVDGSMVYKIPKQIYFNDFKGDFDGLKEILKDGKHESLYKYVGDHAVNEIFKLVEDNLDKFAKKHIFDVIGAITIYDTNNFMCMRTNSNMVNFLKEISSYL